MQLTLVVPELLWPEPDDRESVDALRCDGLNTLIARSRCTRRPPQSLEATLCDAFGLAGNAAYAAFRVLGEVAAPIVAGACWLCADPVHLRLHQERLILADGGSLDITAAEATAIVDELNRQFPDRGTFHVGTPIAGICSLPAISNSATDLGRFDVLPLSVVAGRSVGRQLPETAEWRWLRQCSTKCRWSCISTRPTPDARTPASRRSTACGCGVPGSCRPAARRTSPASGATTRWHAAWVALSACRCRPSPTTPLPCSHRPAPAATHCSFSIRCKRRCSTKTAKPTAPNCSHSKPAGSRRCRKRSPAAKSSACASQHRRPTPLAWESSRSEQWQLWRRPQPLAATAQALARGRSAMTRSAAARVSPRIQWQLEQQGLHPLLARIYAGRGIVARSELDYEFSSLLPPARLTHAAEAAVLLADAIAGQQKILIVADYDCDGATACAVGIRALRAFGADVDYLVPNRFTYGYGLSPDIVDLAATKKPDLIVTVDNGIASVDGVARARQLGIATLITDHHLPGDELPAADCIVNPNLPGCGFPSKASGRRRRDVLRDAGAARRTARARALVSLCAASPGSPPARPGRARHRRRRRQARPQQPGARQPGPAAHPPGPLHARPARPLPRRRTQSGAGLGFDLGFMIGPRLNAAGRLADMSLGIECLITDDPGRALNIAQQLDALNRERREIESGMQEQALLQLARAARRPGRERRRRSRCSMPTGTRASSASSPRASRKSCTARSLPLPAARRRIKGSGRSIAGLHLRDALDLVPSARRPAAALRRPRHGRRRDDARKRLCALSRTVAQVADELLAPADRTRTLETDGGLEAAYFSIATARLLEAEVWGQGFPAPLFEDEFVVESQRILKDKHLKLAASRRRS
jgi:single-stranded-DNA-specific exonuclease